ncbi:Leucine-rich repeat and IQ domain-containing protein 1, partial [Rhizophlyctis rosea]
MHSDAEDDEDIEEIIKQELAALDSSDPLPSSTNDNHVEDDLRRAPSSTSWPMLNASPSLILRAEDEYSLERLTSWQDYINTISERDAERQAILEDDETSQFDESDRERGVVEDVAALAPEPKPPDDEEELVSETAIDERLAQEEAELAERLRELHATSKSEQAILDALNAEASVSGIRAREDRSVTPKESTYQRQEKGAVKEVIPVRGVDDQGRKPSPQIAPQTELPSTFGSASTLAAVEAEEQDLIEEYNTLTKQQRHEAGEQAKLQFRLDSLQNQKASTIRTLRQTKDKMRQLQEKERTLFHWLTHDAKSAYDREKDRSAVLLSKAQALMKKMKVTQEGYRSRLTTWREEGDALSTQKSTLTSSHSTLSTQYQKAQQDLLFLQSQLSAESALLESRRTERDRLLLQKLQQEEAERQLEVELLIRAAHRQRPDRVVEFSEIDFLEAIGVGLRKIPDLSDAANIRHIKLDDNLLSATKGLEVLKNLKTLSLSGNQYSTIDMQCFVLLRSLNAASNQIVGVENADKCKRLQLLNLSYNPLSDVAFLSSVRTLQVLSLSGTQIRDFNPISALTDCIYLDLSSNHLHNIDLKFLSNCGILQCLDLKDNLFTVVPLVPCLLLTDLEMEGNKIEELKIESYSLTLRSMNFNNNQIRKVQPLVNCTFLQELNLQNNLLTDMTDLFAISLCHELRVLDLRKNPLVYDRHFKEAALILLPSLQVLNGDWIERDHKTRPNHLRIIKWCRAAYDFMNPYPAEPEDKELQLQVYDDYFRIVTGQRRNIASFMGPIYIPYQRYLSSPQDLIQDDAGDASQLEETRIGWMTSSLMTNLEVMRDLRKHKPTNFELLLLPWSEELLSQIWMSSIVYTQSRWRMILWRRKRVRCIRAAIRIQSWFRRSISEKKERFEREKSEGLVKTKVIAAVKIQKILRGHKTRKWFENTKEHLRAVQDSRERRKTERTREFGRAKLNASPEVEDIDPALEEWLATTGHEDFDKEMDRYLQDERLHHFSRPVSRGRGGQVDRMGGMELGARNSPHPTDAPRRTMLDEFLHRNRTSTPTSLHNHSAGSHGRHFSEEDGRVGMEEGGSVSTELSQEIWNKQRDRYLRQENKARVREMMK